jgi:transcriptional regulator with XRE-family HTH domain
LSDDSNIPAMRQLSRRNLGAKFSEGARQLWLLLARRTWSQAEAARQLDMDAGQLVKLLYGDRRPGRELAGRLAAGAEINLRLWDEAPTEPFVPPAAEEAATGVRRRKPVRRSRNAKAPLSSTTSALPLPKRSPRPPRSVSRSV